MTYETAIKRIHDLEDQVETLRAVHEPTCHRCGELLSTRVEAWCCVCDGSGPIEDRAELQRQLDAERAAHALLRAKAQQMSELVRASLHPDEIPTDLIVGSED